MATGIYSLRTLNDNWFEDRLQPAGSLSATGPIERKKARAIEPDLAYIGERYDVLARVSRVPPRISYATPDDGFNEKLRTSLVDFAHPRSRPEFAKRGISAPPMITTANAPVCPPERRPLPGPRSGFCAVLNHHREDHDQRFWNTANGDFFGEGPRKRSTKAEPSVLHPAGTTTEWEEDRVLGMKVGKLCGEALSETTNPATDTRTQRAWMPGMDPALRNIEYGGARRIPPSTDNALSLPLGKGAMSKVRADLKDRQGRLYRTATTITKGNGCRYGIAIFQDG